MARRTKSRQMTPAQERAWRAIRAFNLIRPQLQKYAQSLTGNPKLGLEATAEGTYTDGKTIFIRPPARLGDNRPHEKVICNKRNKVTKRQMCPACDAHEMVLAAILHEISHIVFGSSEEPTPAGVKNINDLINEWHPADACDHAEKITTETREAIESTGDSYMLRCNLFDPILGLLLNSFEDSRVNTGMFTARPGARVMFDLHLHEIFHVGISDFAEEDDEPNMWQDRSLDEQVLVGMFLASSEHFDHIDLLSDEAKQIIWSDQLDTLLMMVGRSATVHEVVEHTVSTFRALQDLGVMVIPKCVKVEEEPDAEDDGTEGDAGSGEGEDRDSSPSSGRSESSSPSQDSPNNESAEAGGNDSGASGGSGTAEPDKAPKPEDAGDGKSQDRDEVSDDAASTDGNPGAEDTDSSDDDSDAGADDQSDDNEDGVHPDVDPDSETEEGSEIQPEGDAVEESEEDPDEGQDDGELPQELDREALTKLAQKMSMHTLIKEEVPDSDTTDFASGPSVLSAGESTEDGDGVGGGGVSVAAWTNALSKKDIEEYIKALVTALQQAMFFDTPSVEVQGVDIVTFPHRGVKWYDRRESYSTVSDPVHYTPGENILGRVTNEARLTFEENKRSHYERNLKSGRINTRALGRRAPVEDPRLFQKKNIPGKKDYFVLIGFDISGSTNRLASGPRYTGSILRTLNYQIKRAVYAQAEMCHRLGIPFEIWGHTASWPVRAIDDPDFDYEGTTVWAYQVKQASDPWDEDAKVRLVSCMDSEGNLDGHTLEFYRKRLELQTATDKILCYYTDGAMPAMNYAEEKDILEREVEYCRRTGIHLLAVGIQTDSPRAYGFDTVEINDDVDLVKVPQQLKRALTR